MSFTYVINKDSKDQIEDSDRFYIATFKDSNYNPFKMGYVEKDFVEKEFMETLGVDVDRLKDLAVRGYSHLEIFLSELSVRREEPFNPHKLYYH